MPLTALTCALALLGSALQAPTLPPLPAVLRDAQVTVVLQATSTHFSASNLSGTPQLLLFSEPTSGFRASLWVVPGQHLLLSIPDGAEGFLVEAFADALPSSPSTGSLSVDAMRGDLARPIWARRHSDTLEAVRVLANGITVETVDHGPSLLPMARAHVPAPIPSADRRKKNDKLEKRPLPPV